MRSRLCLAALVCVAATSAAAQERAVTPTDSGIIFNFQDADLRVVLATLAQSAGMNIVYGNLPTRSVTLRTGQPVPLDGIRPLFESVLRANDLQLVQEGAVTRIVTPVRSEDERLGPSRGRAGPGDVRLFVERLRYADAVTMAQTLQAIFGIQTGLAPEVAEGPTSLSQALRQQAIPPLGAPARGAPGAGAAGGGVTPGDSAGVSAVLRGEVAIVPDLVTNALLIRATPADYETIHAAMKELDIRPLQVLIEVLIAEVRHNRSTAVGMNWRIPFQSTDTNVVATLTGGSAGDFVLQVLGIGSVKADVVLNALSTSGTVSILSRPVVVAQNAEEARILVGDQRPFVQVSRALPTDNAARDQVVQYRNVGTQLSIRPTINADGYVSLSLSQEVSSATAETQFGAPVINTRELQTQLLVKDGHTVVIGGLIDTQTDKSASGVPLLKDLPLLGVLFRSSTSRKVSSELFLLVTPHVLRNDDDVDEALRQMRNHTGDLGRTLPDTIPLIRRDTTPTPRDTIPR